MKPFLKKLAIGLTLSAVGLLGVFLFFGHPKTSMLPDKTAEISGNLPAITVAVVKVQRGDLSRHLEITSEFRPYQEVDLHAKVAGYLQHIGVDIGDRVKEGQVLATLEIPEIQEDYKKAGAAWEAAKQEVSRSQAVYDENSVLFQRLSEAAKERPGLIAQQDLDTASDKSRGDAASLAVAQQELVEAEANKNRIQDLIEYAKITAPFDGVITHRYADTGALIQAGTSSSTQSMPVVRLAELKKLRLIFPVPESVISTIHLGDPLEFTVLSEKQTYRATIARFAGKVDTSTRTMTTEAEIDNPDYHFTPGTYASVEVTLEAHPGVLTIPIQALSAGRTHTVMTLDGQNRLQERQVTVGMETPDKVEILSGLQENELVVVGNHSGLQTGQLAIGTLQVPSVDPVKLSSL